MKKGKEIEIVLFKNYHVISGSIDNKNSKSIYINLSTWGQPKINDDINYIRIIRDINKKIKSNVFNLLSSKDTEKLFIKERTIVDLDVRESGIKFNKRSFTNAEITLFLTNILPINSLVLKPMLDNIVKTIVNEVFEKNQYFKFYRRKI